MAAIDLQRGRSWGAERAELQDSFDSEMQEWEEQLQDMQKKIEELYNEVQARRGGNEIANDNGKNARGMDFGPGHHGNGFCDQPGRHGNGNKDHPGAVDVPSHHSNGCNHVANGYGYPVNGQNGSHGYTHGNGVAELGDLLQDYLGQGHGKTRKSSGPHSTQLTEATKASQDMSGYQEEMKRRPGNERIGQERSAGGSEEAENRKNRASHCENPNKENIVAKPPLRQRDTPPVPPRSTSNLPTGPTHDSPALDRKSYNPGVVVDRKCGSPSVLRKFGAMLQENEGKTLTDAGVVTVVTNQVPVEPKCPTPCCHRRGLGAGKTPARVPVQTCQADSHALTAEMDCGQERTGGGGGGGGGGGVAARDCGRERQMAEQQRGTSLGGSYGQPKGPPQRGEAGNQKRAQVGGSPKPKARVQRGADGDREHGGPHSHGERARRPAPQPGEARADYLALGGSPRPQRGRGGAVADPGRDNELIELLDMLEIEHSYSSGPRAAPHTPCRQDTQQVSPAESSPATARRTFHRPARPANQRPPSRWASLTPVARISAPSGPMSRPPSPLARTPSPAPKQQSHCSYSLHTETVIM